MFEKYKAKNPRNVLIIRSSAKLFPSIMEEVKKAFVGAEIDVLTNLSELPESSLREMISHVYKTATLGKFCFSDVPLFQKEVEKKTYDLAIVLYNSRSGFSYLNIDSFAFGSRANKVISVNINKEVKDVSWGRFLYKWAHRVGDCAWVGINYVLACLTLATIFIGMLVTEPIVVVLKMRKRA